MADRNEMEGEEGRKLRSLLDRKWRKPERRAEEKEQFRNSLGIGSALL